eukprot:scaffold242178_cov36-Tisochrysis_lutea.AAC.4
MGGTARLAVSSAARHAIVNDLHLREAEQARDHTKSSRRQSPITTRRARSRSEPVLVMRGGERLNVWTWAGRNSSPLRAALSLRPWQPIANAI